MPSFTPDVYVIAHPTGIEVYGSYRIAATRLYEQGYVLVDRPVPDIDVIANAVRKSAPSIVGDSYPQKFIKNQGTAGQKTVLVQRCTVVRQSITGAANWISQPKLSDIDL